MGLYGFYTGIEEYTLNLMRLTKAEKLREDHLRRTRWGLVFPFQGSFGLGFRAYLNPK